MAGKQGSQERPGGSGALADPASARLPLRVEQPRAGPGQSARAVAPLPPSARGSAGALSERLRRSGSAGQLDGASPVVDAFTYPSCASRPRAILRSPSPH